MKFPLCWNGCWLLDRTYNDQFLVRIEKKRKAEQVGHFSLPTGIETQSLVIKTTSIKKMIIAFYGDSLTEGKVGTSYFDILKKQLPNMTLHNFGRGGDTPISMMKRMKKQGLPRPSDVAVLWIGVNDIIARTSRLYAFKRRLYRRGWARDLAEFQGHYQSLLDLISPSTQYLLTISPLFAGEDTTSPLAKELEAAGSLIERLTQTKKNARFINLRKTFLPLLPKSSFPYKAKKLFPMILQSLRPKREQETESGEYYFTCDGIHLNKRGAEIAARIISEEIGRVLESPSQK